MALTEVYVDPSINADSGTGTDIDAYGDLEYAIEQETFDTTNGTRFNIKTGSTETLAADLSTALADTSVSVAYVPSATARLQFQGYTTTAGDGGVGIISGGGSVAVLSDNTQNYVNFTDLQLTNTGANIVVLMNDSCAVIRCEIDTSTGGGVEMDLTCTAIGNHFHNLSLDGLEIQSGIVMNNYFANGTNDFGNAINVIAGPTPVIRNIINVDGASNGINLANGTNLVMNNSVYSNAGSGTGISTQNGGAQNIVISNNIVEGFTTGTGINVNKNARCTDLMGNAAYNNGTNYDLGTGPYHNYDKWGDGTDTNEVLSASGFTNAGAADFSPVDTGSVKEGSLPDDVGNGAI